MADVTVTGEAQAQLGPLRRLKLWVWFKEHARLSDLQVTLCWAGIVGFAGAIMSIGFRVATAVVHKALTRDSTPAMVESFAHLSLFSRLLIPAAGGLIAGSVLHFGMRWHGKVITTDYMEAVVLGD